MLLNITLAGGQSLIVDKPERKERVIYTLMTAHLTKMRMLPSYSMSVIFNKTLELPVNLLGPERAFLRMFGRSLFVNLKLRRQISTLQS